MAWLSWLFSGAALPASKSPNHALPSPARRSLLQLVQLSQQVVQLKFEWLEGQYGFAIEDHLQRPAAAGLSLMSCLGPRLAFAKERGIVRE